MAGKLNIYLIGLSGTGKTRSGQLVAEVLGWPFVEMDGVIEDRCGKTIPDIFKDNGEHYFRDLESQILEEVAERGGRVVSTGGGVPIRSQNRKTMNSTGLVIRLTASSKTIHKRLAISSKRRGRSLRPLLGNDAPIESIENMMTERETAYATASITLDTEHKSHHQVAKKIIEVWRNSEMAE